MIDRRCYRNVAPLKTAKEENEQIKDNIITSKSKEEIDMNAHASDVTSLPVPENTMTDPLKQARQFYLILKEKRRVETPPLFDFDC